MAGTEKVTVVEFYWDDLTDKKKQELLDMFGDNFNWDCFPFCTLEISDDNYN